MSLDFASCRVNKYLRYVVVNLAEKKKNNWFMCGDDYELFFVCVASEEYSE